MKLADKIIKLRKQFGWSQEDLAEKLNVSRQSVSKWEGALSIPDLNKIMKLAQIFGVSTDYLLKDDIEEYGEGSQSTDDHYPVVTLNEANTYVNTAFEKSQDLVKGLFVLILAVVPLLSLLALKSGSVIGLSDALIVALGLTIMFVFITIGVIMMVNLNQKYELNPVVEALTFELEYGADSIFKEKLQAYKATYLRYTSNGIGLLILSPLPIMITAALEASGMVILLMVVLLFVLVCLGLYFLIPASTVNESYKKLLHQGDYALDRLHESKRVNAFGAFYWPLVVAIYIGWSLWTMNWGVTWIVWPVAALIFAALIGLINFIHTK